MVLLASEVGFQDLIILLYNLIALGVKIKKPFYMSDVETMIIKAKWNCLQAMFC